MRILTIRQPWASLIVSGHKDIENRTWSTPYRGTLLILAGKTVDREALALHGHLLPAGDLPRGGIVGAVTLVDCVRQHASDWFHGPVGWVLSEPRETPFIERRGALYLERVEDALLELLKVNGFHDHSPPVR